MAFGIAGGLLNASISDIWTILFGLPAVLCVIITFINLAYAFGIGYFSEAVVVPLLVADNAGMKLVPSLEIPTVNLY